MIRVVSANHVEVSFKKYCGEREGDVSEESTAGCATFAHPIMPAGKRTHHRPTEKKVRHMSFQDTEPGKTNKPTAAITTRARRK
jgi:hypothetical protein